MEENVATLKPISLDSLIEKDSEIEKKFDESNSVPAQQDEENPKECNYFAESQQHRIDSMIRNGMEPEEAISKESERYAQLVAQWTMNDVAVESSAAACISSLENTAKEVTKEMDDKADSEEEKSTKNLNNFTGGQIKRIVAMIKCGIEPEKARDLEQERNDKFAAQKLENEADETSIQAEMELQRKGDNSVAKESSKDGKLTTKQEKFTSSQKRRIAAMIKDGIQPETARKFERIRYARLQAQSLEQGDEITSGSKRSSSPNNSMQPEFKKPRHESEMLNADKKPTSLPTTLQSRVNYYNYELAIIHTRDPEVTLTLQEIHTIKVALLNEMDKSDYSNIHHQFVENFIKDGWWSVTCQNIQTKAWIMSTVPQLKLWPNTSIKVINTPNLYRCVTLLSAEDFMPKHLFLSRLQKQNFDLKTGKWRIINVEKNHDNGETITFSVDEQSKEGILKQGQKLWLNFSQIYVKIEPRLLTRKRN